MTANMARPACAPAKPRERAPNQLAEQITGRPYLSHSQLYLMRTCPRKFVFQYVEKARPDFVPSPFIAGEASLYLELGCRIKVVKDTELTAWHRLASESRGYGANVQVNFHGQVIAFSFPAVTGHELHYLVDLTGEPTGLRLMLPARTRLIENEAFDQLKAALELETYRHLKVLGQHRLPYKQFLRARELGIALPEAEPCFSLGLLSNAQEPEPVEVKMPKDHPLASCYRLGAGEIGNDSDEANAHLLAALGRFDQPLVPVEIRSEYDGYL